MSLVVGLFKDTLRLTAASFIVIVFGFGVALLYGRRTAAWGRRWLTGWVLAYWILALPIGAWMLSLPAARSYHPIETRAEARGAETIVMLGGGIVSRTANGMAIDDLGPTAMRLIETARLYKLLGDPLVIVSGGPTQQDLDPLRPEAAAYKIAIVRLGVPESRVLVEDQSMTTREEAIVLKPILAARGITRFVLVTSPTHMGRSLATFRSVGLDPVPSTSQVFSSETTWWTIAPTRGALTISDTAVYDYMATVYYWMRGWL
jgi:uncharacterized SAM-binding protein YcdF (DUF218 family)